MIPGIGLPFDIFISERDCSKSAFSLDCGLAVIGFVPVLGDGISGSGKVLKFCMKSCNEARATLTAIENAKNAKTLAETERALRAIRDAGHGYYDVGKLSAGTNGLLSSDTIRHALDGTNGGGAHFWHSTSNFNVDEIDKLADSKGVITAYVKSGTEVKYSSFYPVGYDDKKVIQETVNAWGNAKEIVSIGDKPVVGGYLGKDSSGISIQFYTDASGKITAFFPVHANDVGKISTK